MDPVIYPDLRKKLLSLRAADGAEISQPPATPQSTPPHLGHNSGMISLQQGYNLTANGFFADLNWRPAMHSLDENPMGYSNNLGISFLDTQLRYELPNHNFYLKNLHLVEITSLASEIPNDFLLSWHADLGYERYFADRYSTPSGRVYIQIGVGLSSELLDKKAIIFIIPEIDSGMSKLTGLHYGPNFLAGLIFQPVTYLKLFNKIEIGRKFYYDHYFQGLNSYKLSSNLSLYLRQNFNIKLGYMYDESFNQLFSGVEYYF